MKQRPWLAFGLIFAVYLLFALAQWRDPAIEDELLIQKGALLWLQHGADRFEMAHTPVYLESLSLWQKIWGDAGLGGEQYVRMAIVRSFGTFMALVTLAIFYWGLLGRRARAGTLAAEPWLAVALVAWNPYFVQGTLLADYDVTVQAAPLLLWVLAADSWDRAAAPRWRWSLGLGALLGLALFAKELTPLVLLGIWPGWAWLRRWRSPDGSFKRHLAQSIAGLGVAALLFIALLMAWARWRGFAWTDPLAQSLWKVGNRQVHPLFSWQKYGTGRFGLLSYLTVLWVGVPTLAWIATHLREDLKLPRGLASALTAVARVPVALWISIGIFAAYTWIVQTSFYFPKYTLPAWVLLIYGLASLLTTGGSNGDIDPARSPRRGKLGAVAVAALLLWGRLADLVTPSLDPLMIAEYRRELSAAVLLAHAVGLLVPLAMLELLRRTRRPGFALAGLLALFLGTDVRQLRADYATRYLYGEAGFEAAVEASASRLVQASAAAPIISTARDVAWALGEERARYVDLVDHQDAFVDAGVDLARSPMVVSRVYGLCAIRLAPAIRARVQAAYPCHRVVDARGGRFEWWWRPAAAGVSCD